MLLNYTIKDQTMNNFKVVGSFVLTFYEVKLTLVEYVKKKLQKE